MLGPRTPVPAAVAVTAENEAAGNRGKELMRAGIEAARKFDVGAQSRLESACQSSQWKIVKGAITASDGPRKMTTGVALPKTMRAGYSQSIRSPEIDGALREIAEFVERNKDVKDLGDERGYADQDQQRILGALAKVPALCRSVWNATGSIRRDRRERVIGQVLQA